MGSSQQPCRSGYEASEPLLLLRVMNEEIRVCSDPSTRGPLPAPWKLWNAKRRLVVGDRGEHHASGCNPVAHRRPGVAHKGRGDRQHPDRHGTTGDFVEMQRAGQIPQPHRKQRRHTRCARRLSRGHHGYPGPPHHSGASWRAGIMRPSADRRTVVSWGCPPRTTTLSASNRCAICLPPVPGALSSAASP